MIFKRKTIMYPCQQSIKPKTNINYYKQPSQTKNKQISSSSSIRISPGRMHIAPFQTLSLLVSSQSFSTYPINFTLIPLPRGKSTRIAIKVATLAYTQFLLVSATSHQHDKHASTQYSRPTWRDTAHTPFGNIHPHSI